MEMNEITNQTVPHMFICFITFQTIVSPAGNTDTHACTLHVLEETTFISKRSFFARIPSLFPAPHMRAYTRASDIGCNVLQK